ncbi:MAG: cell wall hydrolase [Sphingomonadales bacterium]|nr:cell wall hydrolase [Sphingomonadales bacterium]
MPFEQAGESFPGSAFYYLDAASPAPAADLAPDAHWDSDAGMGGDPAGPGPAAKAIRQAGSEIDRTRALTCLTAAVYYEAASEPDAGQRAVAQVVLNRMAHPAYPKTVCGVVYQGSERSTGCQFTFTCDGALARKPVRLFWERAEAVARAALAGYVYAPVGLATHYHTFAVHPYWAPSLHFLGQIGAHRFYRMEGPAGSLAAFRFAYAGGEPLTTGHTRSTGAASGADSPDPLAIERAYAASLKAAHGDFQQAGLLAARSIAAAPAPAYAGEALQRGGDAAFRARALPAGDTVKAEYQASGSWIASPE